MFTPYIYFRASNLPRNLTKVTVRTRSMKSYTWACTIEAHVRMSNRYCVRMLGDPHVRMRSEHRERMRIEHRECMRSEQRH